MKVFKILQNLVLVNLHVLHIILNKKILKKEAIVFILKNKD